MEIRMSLMRTPGGNKQVIFKEINENFPEMIKDTRSYPQNKKKSKSLIESSLPRQEEHCSVTSINI